LLRAIGGFGSDLTEPSLPDNKEAALKQGSSPNKTPEIDLGLDSFDGATIANYLSQIICPNKTPEIDLGLDPPGVLFFYLL
jgi:hypothetical protein